MNTQLRAWCVGVLEAVVLLAVAVVPVFVNYYSFRVFEQDKAALLTALALVGALATLVALVEGGMDAVRALRTALRQPLVGATVLLGVVTALATAASIAPRVSFFGSLDRAQGLLGLLACLVLFAAAAWLGREPARRRRMVAAMILASVPVAAYAVVQVAGLAVVPGKVEGPLRAFGTLSNPIFLGAYLMLLFPLTLTRSLAAAREGRGVAFSGYLVIALLQVLALLLTASRGPQLGWAVSLLVLGLAGAVASRRRGLGWSLVGLALAGGLFLVLFNLPNSPLASLKTLPVVGRFGEIGDVPNTSGAARMAIWRSVDRMLVAEPARLALGHGPETLKYALLPYAEPNLGGSGQRGYLADRSHSVLLDALAMTGLPGALALLLVYGAWLSAAAVAAGLAPTRGDRRRLLICLVVGTVAGALGGVLLRPPYVGALTCLGMVAGLLAYLVLALARSPAAVARSSKAAAEAEASENDGSGGSDAPATTSARRSDNDADAPAPKSARPVAQAPAPLNWTALAFLAIGAAAVTEAAFGIQTVVTQTIFWVLAGLLVGIGAGDGLVAVATHPTGAAAGASRARRPLDERGAARSGSEGAAASSGAVATVTLTWSAGGAAIGLVTGCVMALLVYSLVIFGTQPLADTYLVLFTLLGLTWLGGLVAAVDAGDGAFLAGLISLLVAGVYALLRLTVLVVAQDATVLFAATVMWLLISALLAGFWLRARPAKAPYWRGMVGLAYPFAAVIPVTLVFLWAVRPVQADMIFQAALANFGAAVQGQMADADRFKAAEALYDRAAATNPDQPLYPMLWGERWTALGAAAGADVEAAAGAFDKAQALSDRAAQLEPQLPYHEFNRGHLQLVFAQMLPLGQREQVAKNAGDALQGAFNKLPFDPQVATELGMARLMERNFKEALRILEYVRDNLDKENPAIYEALGQAYQDAGETEKAKLALEEAVKRGGKNPQTYITLGELARDAKDLPGAIDYYNKALANGSQDWQVVYNLGLLYRDTGDFNKALDALSAALKYAPEDDQPRIQESIDGLLQKGGSALGAIPALEATPEP